MPRPPSPFPRRRSPVALSLALNPAWSWWLVAAFAAGLTGLVLWTYPPRVRHLSPRTRRTLVGLRLAGVALLTFALLRPELRREETERDDPAVLVLADASRSMSVRDEPGGASRYERLKAALDAAAAPLASLGETAAVAVNAFDAARVPPTATDGGEDAAPAAALPAEPGGDRTALGAVLAALARDPGEVSSVLLMSDGADRDLPPDARDPLVAARLLAEAGVRVYAVPFGSDGAPTAGLDLAVDRLTVDPVVFVKKQVPVSGTVRIAGGAGREFVVRLLIEDRTGVGPGQSGELVPLEPGGEARPVVRVTPPGPNAEIPVELSFVPEVPGEVKIALEIVPVDGELKTTNNRRATVVSVRKGGIRVLYFDRVRPEVNAIRGVNLSDKIQLDFVELPARPNNLSPGLRLEPELFEPGRYDAFVIGDVAAEAFKEGRNDFLRDLAARVDDGAGLMMTGGLNSFGPGDYGRSPLRTALPVELPRGGAVDRPDARDQIDGELPMLPTRLGNQSYLMLLTDPAENDALWRSLPPLNGANRLAVKPGVPAEVWAAGPDDQPLLVAYEYGRSRVLAFAGDTTWLWPLSGFAEAHARFWRQVVLWLTRKEEEGEGPVFVTVEPKNVAPGRPARLTFGARDAENAPIPDAKFAVEVTDPNGEIAALTPRAAGTGPRDAGRFVAEAVDTDAPGDYWVRVRAEKDGTLVGPDALARFVVDAVDLELDNPAADPGLLASIAEATGGAVVPPEELTAFLERWAEEPPGGAEQTVLSRTPLYDGWWIPLLFAALLGGEWYLRKKRGLV